MAMANLGLYSLFTFVLLVLPYLATSIRDPSFSSVSESSFTSILGNSPLVHSFAAYAHRFGKNYKTVDEVRHRFDVFVDSVKLIGTRNSENKPYKLGLTQFADVSWEEFQSTHLGAAQNCSATTTSNNHLRSLRTVPSSKDWRLDGIVSDVKNQGHCGSCWTFSTTGALEAAYKQATGESVLLSEQQLIDCAGDFNNFGCSGGLPSQAFQYIMYNGGLDTEASYPYLAQNGECQFSSDSVGVKVYDAVNITLGDENELKSAVGLVRPVSVAFEVISEFRLYESGVFTSENCDSSPQTVNHAVLAVGYDVDENGTPYWIIKNSWGSSWGMEGYFNMEMGKNMCGVATCASYPVVTEEESKIQTS